MFGVVVIVLRVDRVAADKCRTRQGREVLVFALPIDAGILVIRGAIFVLRTLPFGDGVSTIVIQLRSSLVSIDQVWFPYLLIFYVL